MKRNFKNVVITSFIASIGLTSSISIFGINYLSSYNSINIINKSMNSDLVHKKSISFNGKKYNSIEDAIAEYEKANVSIETYIGDFYKESSSGYNYRKIYLNKNEVHKNDYSKIKPAYLTSYGKSTMDADISKKSYIEQPIAAYKDIYGNIFYTERDAINSNAKTINFSPISYYQIDDYSTSSKFSTKYNKVNINPLNKNDLLELKKLALWNIDKESSSFAINYYYANENPYGNGITRYEKPENINSYISLDKNTISSKDKIFYAITFNGVPLFKFNQDWISNHFFVNKYFDSIENKFVGGNMVEGMKQNPSKYITQFISETLKKWKENDLFVDKNFFNKLLNSLDNVSNNLKFDKIGNWYLEKKLGVPFDRNDTIIGFTTKEINGNKNQEFKDKFIDDSKFASFGVSNEELNLGLKANKSDDDSILIHNAGLFKSIYDYNNSLKSILESSSSLPIDNLKNNMVSNPNDIIFLFDKDKSKNKVKYSEYPNYNIHFNKSISKNNVDLIQSVEEKQEFSKQNSVESIETIWLVYDRRGDLLSESVSRDVAIENAINASKPEVDLDFVYYEKDNKFLKIKNQISELNVLKIDNEYYGFITYQELYNYLYEYIKMSSIHGDNNGDNVIPPVHETVPFQPNDISISDITNILSTFASLDEVNRLTIEQKFNKFGSVFKINSLENWNKFIGNGLLFIDKQKLKLSFINSKYDNALQEVKTGIMIVNLQNGYKFSDGNTSFKKEVTYVPNISNMPDSSIGNKTTHSRTSNIISVSIAIVIIVVLELMVLTTTIINKRKKENNSLKIFDNYYK